jgi:hypothetical protein
MWCDEYVLMFDNESILREWTHRAYFHGGEAFPDFCVPDRSARRDEATVTRVDFISGPAVLYSRSASFLGEEVYGSGA